MDDNFSRSFRLEQLLQQQRKKHRLHEPILFQECVAALGDGVIVYSEDKTTEMYEWFEELFDFTSSGRMIWDRFSHSHITLPQLQERFSSMEEEVYVLWSHDPNPLIRCRLATILEHIEDVLAVSGDTWLWKPDHLLIEFSREEDIRIHMTS